MRGECESTHNIKKTSTSHIEHNKGVCACVCVCLFWLVLIPCSRSPQIFVHRKKNPFVPRLPATPTNVSTCGACWPFVCLFGLVCSVLFCVLCFVVKMKKKKEHRTRNDPCTNKIDSKSLKSTLFVGIRNNSVNLFFGGFHFYFMTSQSIMLARNDFFLPGTEMNFPTTKHNSKNTTVN